MWLPTAAPSTVAVDAQGQEQRLALVTSKPLFGVVVGCTAVAGLLLGFLELGVGDKDDKREPLELGSAIRAVQMNMIPDNEEPSGYRDDELPEEYR